MSSPPLGNHALQHARDAWIQDHGCSCCRSRRRSDGAATAATAATALHHRAISIYDFVCHGLTAVHWVQHQLLRLLHALPSRLLADRVGVDSIVADAAAAECF